MANEQPNQFGRLREGAMTSARPQSRELAERSSNGTQVRLLWRHGTSMLWIEVREPDDRLLSIPVRPERALDAFYHPYAYAGRQSLLPAESLRGAGENDEQ